MAIVVIETGLALTIFSGLASKKRVWICSIAILNDKNRHLHKTKMQICFTGFLFIFLFLPFYLFKMHKTVKFTQNKDENLFYWLFIFFSKCIKLLNFSLYHPILCWKETIVPGSIVSPFLWSLFVWLCLAMFCCLWAMQLAHKCQICTEKCGSKYW